MSVPTTFAARCSCANPRVTNSCHFQADRRNLRRGLCIPVSLVPVMAVVLLPGVSGGPGLNHAQANMAAPWAYHDDQRGDEVPLWFLDGDNYLGEIDFPPMSEGVVMIENRLAVLSESGASKYQLGGKGPLDVVVFLDVSTFK